MLRDLDVGDPHRVLHGTFVAFVVAGLTLAPQLNGAVGASSTIGAITTNGQSSRVESADREGIPENPATCGVAVPITSLDGFLQIRNIAFHLGVQIIASRNFAIDAERSNARGSAMRRIGSGNKSVVPVEDENRFTTGPLRARGVVEISSFPLQRIA